MVEVICRYCGTPFEAKRKSREVCDKEECRNKIQETYYKNNPDKQDDNRFRQSKRNIKQNFRKWKEINRDISNDNRPHIAMRLRTCNDCGEEFMAGAGRNCTLWNAAICPRCGLVEKSVIDTDPWEYHLKYQPHPANQDEINECKKELRKVKIYPILKKYAIYLDKQKTVIDFPQELIALRGMLNNLKERKNKKETIIRTTPEEEQICFKALNEKLIKNKGYK